MKEKHIICIKKVFHTPGFHPGCAITPLSSYSKDEHEFDRYFQKSKTSQYDIPDFDDEDSAKEWLKSFVETYNSFIDKYNESIKNNFFAFPLINVLPKDFYIIKKLIIE